MLRAGGHVRASGKKLNATTAGGQSFEMNGNGDKNLSGGIAKGADIGGYSFRHGDIEFGLQFMSSKAKGIRFAVSNGRVAELQPWCCQVGGQRPMLYIPHRAIDDGDR